MTDKALLELAAKAAGIEIDKSPYNGGGYGNTGFDSSGNAVLDWHNNVRWNPLTNDGDALRLAVKLKMPIFISNDIARCVWGYGLPQSCVEAVGADPYAATRRAIVRAAAEIGRTM